MRLRFLLATILIILLSLSSVSAQVTDISIGKGSLKLGGILQAGYTWHAEDKEGFDSFTINRARFLMWGEIIPDQVTYFVQLETKSDVSLLDYKAALNYIPKTKLIIGRFLPNLTLYMPSSTAKLEMINYPLTTSRFAPWRQIGIQSVTKTEFAEFTLGILNGADQPNNTADNNDAKDFLFRADFIPPIEWATVRCGGYAWIGRARPEFNDETGDSLIIFPEETLKNNMFGGFIKLDYDGPVPIRFRGEYIASTAEHLTDGNIGSIDETKRMAYLGHLGIRVHPTVEILARYDAYDPDTDIDNNIESWLTGGLNYYIEGGNAMVYLNYIHKMEEGTDIENDLVLGQIQITF